MLSQAHVPLTFCGRCCRRSVNLRTEMLRSWVGRMTELCLNQHRVKTSGLGSCAQGKGPSGGQSAGEER